MAQRASKGAPRGRKGRWFRITLLAICAMVIVGLGVATGLVLGALRTLPALARQDPTPFLSSVIYDKNGREVTKVYGTENRVAVDIDRVPKQVQNAFVAVEDKNFWRHFGLDLRGIARALYNDVRNRSLQGGSTITQQLARNAFPIGRERSLRRKLQEAILAIELERRYTKKEILEMYLNTIYFGRDVYGIEAAAQLYFGHQPKDGCPAVCQLTVAEAALLAGLPQAPNDYEPIGNPERAVWRRNVVLDLMAENGSLTPEEAARYKRESLSIAKGSQPRRFADYPAPHFVDYVLAQLLKKYSPAQVYQGGLKVYTTLDPKIQQAAEAAVRKHLEKFPLNKPDAPQAAVVTLDPWTGYVRAIVGGRDHKKVLELNRAWYDPAANCCARQPGSSFKPVAVYAPALASRRYTAASVLDDTPKTWQGPGYTSWTPKNYDNKYQGLTTLREAVRRSVNIPAVRVLERLKPKTGLEFARKLGITTLVTSGPTNDQNLSLALGGLTRGASVMDMARAYAAFANGGQRLEPIAILKVVDADGNVLEENTPRLERVMTPEVAYVMTDILRSVVEPQPAAGWILTWGTGANARIPRWPTAGKTGTTSDNKDVWFVGYTPKYVTAVWIGRDNPKKAASLPSAISGGGNQPAKIFRDTMVAAHQGMKPTNFLRPRGIVARPISIKSGKLAGPDTPAEWVRQEIFVAGTEPRDDDDAMVQATVCAERPDVLYDAACGCTATTRLFLKRDVLRTTDGRFLSNDMALAPPTRSCLNPDSNAAPVSGADGGGTTGDGAPDGTGAGEGAGDGAGGAGAGAGTGGERTGGEDGGTDTTAATLRMTVQRGSLSPSMIRVTRGSPLQLRIASTDEEHEIVIPDLGVRLTVPAGREAATTFTAGEPGIYLIQCTRHDDEFGRLMVTP